jgi:hypothetical protein
MGPPGRTVSPDRPEEWRTTENTEPRQWTESEMDGFRVFRFFRGLKKLAKEWWIVQRFVS